MELSLCEIMDNKVWVIEIKYGDRTVYTLHYDSESGESVLHTDDNLACFDSLDKLRNFCKEKQIILATDDIARSFDFNLEINEDAQCKRLIENWNLLITMAGALGIEFEGNKKEYDRLYSRLFDHATPTQILVIDKPEQARLTRVFEGRTPIFEKIITIDAEV